MGSGASSGIHSHVELADESEPTKDQDQLSFWAESSLYLYIPVLFFTPLLDSKSRISSQGYEYHAPTPEPWSET